MEEIFKPINGFEKYEISNYGVIRRAYKGDKMHYLKPINSDRIEPTNVFVILTLNGQRRKITLSKVVAEHFMEKYNPSKRLFYKDCDKTNCHVNNLFQKILC